MKLTEQMDPERRRPGATSRVLLAADVGGTHARIGLAVPQDSGRWPVRLLEYRDYRCNEWPSLAAIVADFVAHRCPGYAVAECALAVAGYVRNDELVAENLRWPVQLTELRRQCGLHNLVVLNDFEALACATQFLSPGDAVTVIEGRAAPGPVIVIGPGTGLGCAVLLPDAAGMAVLPTEAGHVALPAGNELEREVLRVLSRDRDYVPSGHALSGPGIVNLYRALAEIHGLTPVFSEPAQISAAALQRSDRLAGEALHMFCAMLGGFAGDLAVLFKASGGVWLAGGILPLISKVLLEGEFSARFFNKGVMRGFLSGVPVHLIEHGQLGVIGAACQYLRAHPQAQ